MELGSSIAVAGVAISAAAVWIKVIGARIPPPPNGKCGAHSGIEATLIALKQGQERIEKNYEAGQARLEKSIERIFILHDDGKL